MKNKPINKTEMIMIAKDDFPLNNTTQNKEELVKEQKRPELLSWIRKIASKMFPQYLKEEYSMGEVENLLIAVGEEHKNLLSQAHQSGIEEERKRIIKVIESFIDPNPVFLEEHREKIFLKEVIKSLKENKQ